MTRRSRNTHRENFKKSKYKSTSTHYVEKGWLNTKIIRSEMILEQQNGIIVLMPSNMDFILNMLLVKYWYFCFFWQHYSE